MNEVAHPVIRPPKVKAPKVDAPAPLHYDADPPVNRQHGVVEKLHELQAEAETAFAHMGATVSAEFGKVVDFFRNHIKG